LRICAVSVIGLSGGLAAEIADVKLGGKGRGG